METINMTLAETSFFENVSCVDLNGAYIYFDGRFVYVEGEDNAEHYASVIAKSVVEEVTPPEKLGKALAKLGLFDEKVCHVYTFRYGRKVGYVAFDWDVDYLEYDYPDGWHVAETPTLTFVKEKGRKMRIFDNRSNSHDDIISSSFR